MNAIKDLNKSIYSFLISDNLFSLNQKHVTLVKKHSDDLQKTGDFSFPLQMRVWCHAIDCYHGTNIQEFNEDNIFYFKHKSEVVSLEEILKMLIDQTKNWTFPLEKVKILEGKCLLFLDRTIAIRSLLYDVLQNQNFAKQNKSSEKLITFEKGRDDNIESISNYRALIIMKIVQNILEFTDWNIVEEDNQENVIKLNFVSTGEKGRKPESEPNKLNICISCGIVCDPVNKKMAKLTYLDYLRSKDMQLMAMHKYGIRIPEEKRFSDLIDKLGKAAVTVDIVEVKYSSPVSIIRSGQGSSKGASFIMYNCARAYTLLRTFDEKIESGYYPTLPQFEEINTNLLKEEEEWQLLFNYVLYFPELLSSTIDNIENGKCAPHLICHFLNGMASLFSTYYRRENRQHLLPTLFSRIYLVKSVQKIFDLCLNILDIDPVEFM